MPELTAIPASWDEVERLAPKLSYPVIMKPEVAAAAANGKLKTPTSF